MTFFWQAVAMTLCVWVNDLAWALYIRRSAAGLALAAGRWAALIYSSGILLTISAIHDYRLIIVGTVATFIGTSFTVWRDAK